MFFFDLLLGTVQLVLFVGGSAWVYVDYKRGWRKTRAMKDSIILKLEEMPVFGGYLDSPEREARKIDKVVNGLRQ